MKLLILVSLCAGCVYLGRSERKGPFLEDLKENECFFEREPVNKIYRLIKKGKFASLVREVDDDEDIIYSNDNQITRSDCPEDLRG